MSLPTLGRRRMTTPHPGGAMPAHTAAHDRVRMLQIEIRVRGPVLVADAARWGMCASTETACTVLRGPLADRPALHGALERIRASGLELVEVRRLPETAA